MPEGHTLHRIAGRHRSLFAGHRIAVSSPQGRFAADAELLDGRTLRTVEAYGKHLFYRWVDAPNLHVHLGLVGTFRAFTGDGPAPTAGTRLAMVNTETDPVATAYLAGPMTCRLVDDDEIAAVIAKLGPDPIASRRGRAAFVAGLAKRRKPVSAVLLDQSLLAGIGNVYRAELLFLLGIHPATPADAIDEATASALWDLTVDELRIGVKLGRIVTVRPEEIGARLYVYKREGLPCRRCGTEIRIDEVGARSTWWCPVCQPVGVRANNEEQT